MTGLALGCGPMYLRWLPMEAFKGEIGRHIEGNLPDLFIYVSSDVQIFRYMARGRPGTYAKHTWRVLGHFWI